MNSSYTKVNSTTRFIGKSLVACMAILLFSQVSLAGQVTASIWKGNSPRNQERLLSLHVKNELLPDVLQDLARKVEVGISYETEIVPSKKVSYQAEKKSVFEILEAILKNTDLQAVLSNNRKVIVIQKKAPEDRVVLQSTVTGTVTDMSTGETLPGVNISVKGTTIGTTSDAQGQFELNVPSANDTLKFSFVGYKPKIIPLQGRTELGEIALESQTYQAEEVIVTGYTEKEKGELTGSISQVKGSDIAESPTVEIERGLQGKVAGLKINDRGGQPGTSNLDILVRGKSTLGDNDPLVVIDGIPSDTKDLSTLSSQDIESVNVLKDASAAIYGARAANGVIVVKTKRGKEGPTKISINASSGVSTFTRLPDMMSSYQYAKYRSEMEARYGQALTYTPNDLQLFKNGSQPLTHPNSDWYDAGLRDYAPKSHVNLAASGGNENLQYYVSGDYSNQGTMFRDGDMYSNRYQVRSNIDARLLEYLDVGVDISGKLRKNHLPPRNVEGLMNLLQTALPTSTARYPNGYPGIGPGGMNPTVASTDDGGWNETKDKIFKSKLSADLNMDWLTKGLILKGVASFNFDINNGKRFRNTWNEYKYDAQNDKYISRIGSVLEKEKYTSLQEYNKVNQQQYYNLSLNYSKSFGDHNLDGFIAYEQNEGNWEDLTGYRRDLLSAQKIYLYAASTNQQSATGTASNFGRLSYFGSVSYNYKRKYLLDFTLRRDGSYNFAQGKRFGTFPSVSVGWRISDEPFMNSTQSWLDDLKIRSSYGIMGNDRVPAFQYLTKYNVTSGDGYYVFGESRKRYDGFMQSNVPNPNITWEVARNWDIGFDASLLNNKLSVNFDYFYEKRRDILIRRNESVPLYTGLSLPQENLGKVDNSGIEISANYQQQKSDWGYKIGGNFSYNLNKVVYLDEAKNVPEYRKKEGHPVDSWLVYKTDGIFNDQQEIDNTEAVLEGTKPGDIKYVDLNNDESINGDDRYRRYTSPTPKIQYGLNFGVNYKNVEVSAFFQGQAKAENYVSHLGGGQSNLPTYLYSKRWTENNKNAAYPRASDKVDSYNIDPRSDFWLYNAAFVRLKNVILAYNLPAKLTSNAGFKKIRIYVKGFNLWTLDAMSNRMGGKYYDPELNSEAGASYYPQQTSVVAGLSIDL